ncbi:MAG: hypothetical protein II836_10050 [Clostridia bacterium]|nr:hypothetical protein [Clostridia bacterium]
MKTFLQTAKLLLIGWGLAAAAVVLASFVSPERADMRLLRVVLLEVTLVTVPAHLVFRSPMGSLLTRRIVVTACAAVIAAAVPVFCGIQPFTWTFCAWTVGGIVGASALAFVIADRIEAHILARINEKLGQNE